MPLTLYTPGHGFFMDTLIMYGLISPFLERSDIDFEVHGVGGFFEIQVANLSLDEYAELLSNEINDQETGITNLLLNELRLVQRQSEKRLVENLKRLSRFKEARGILESYLTPGHSESEGRRTGGQHTWLPLYPHLGKYSPGSFRYAPKNYVTCPACIALASLGFKTASIAIRGLKSRNKIQTILLTFEGKLPGEILKRMLLYVSSEFNENIRVDKRVRRAADILPLTTFTNLLLTYLTSDLIVQLYEAEASFIIQSLTFEIIRGGVVQIRGYGELPVDKYLSSLAQLIMLDKEFGVSEGSLKKLRSISEELIRKEEATALEALYSFLNTRSPLDLYKASRQIVKSLEKGFGKLFCQELAFLIQVK